MKLQITKEDMKSVVRTCFIMILTFGLGLWFVFATAIAVFWLKGTF